MSPERTGSGTRGIHECFVIDGKLSSAMKSSPLTPGMLGGGESVALSVDKPPLCSHGKRGTAMEEASSVSIFSPTSSCRECGSHLLLRSLVSFLMIRNPCGPRWTSGSTLHWTGRFLHMSGMRKWTLSGLRAGWWRLFCTCPAPGSVLCPCPSHFLIRELHLPPLVGSAKARH